MGLPQETVGGSLTGCLAVTTAAILTATAPTAQKDLRVEVCVVLDAHVGGGPVETAAGM